MKKIMFICTSNICRSPMAEAILKKVAKERQKEVESYSCGIFAQDGERASEEAITVLKEEYGIDYSNYRSQNIRNSKIEEMNIILCMTNQHKQMVVSMYPELEKKIFALEQYANKEYKDIKDPWGYDLTTYRKCASQIYNAIDKIVNEL